MRLLIIGVAWVVEKLRVSVGLLNHIKVLHAQGPGVVFCRCIKRGRGRPHPGRERAKFSLNDTFYGLYLNHQQCYPARNFGGAIDGKGFSKVWVPPEDKSRCSLVVLPLPLRGLTLGRSIKDPFAIFNKGWAYRKGWNIRVTRGDAGGQPLHWLI